MVKNKIPFIIITFCSLFIVTVACGNMNQPTNSGTSQTEKPGNFAPMFDLIDLKGNNISLEKLAGKKVYIKYWASWCSICLAGLSELDTLSSEENDFEVLTIVSPNYNGEKSPDKFSKWFDELGYKNLIVLLDDDGFWSRKFTVLAYPTSYYISSKGILVKNIIGHNSNEIIKGEMDKIQ